MLLHTVTVTYSYIVVMLLYIQSFGHLVVKCLIIHLSCSMSGNFSGQDTAGKNI